MKTPVVMLLLGIAIAVGTLTAQAPPVHQPRQEALRDSVLWDEHYRGFRDVYLYVRCNRDGLLSMSVEFPDSTLRDSSGIPDATHAGPPPGPGKWGTVGFRPGHALRFCSDVPDSLAPDASPGLTEQIPPVPERSPDTTQWLQIVVTAANQRFVLQCEGKRLSALTIPLSADESFPERRATVGGGQLFQIRPAIPETRCPRDSARMWRFLQDSPIRWNRP